MKLLLHRFFFSFSYTWMKVMFYVTFFSFSTQAQSIQSNWIEPAETPYKVGKYHKLEIGMQLPISVQRKISAFRNNPKNGLNPFSPEDINLQVELISPKNDTLIRYGFYYEKYLRDSINDIYTPGRTLYNWLFRFAPHEIGRWKANITLYVKSKKIDSPTVIEFECIPSNHKGRLVAKKNERLLQFEENGEPFYAIGASIAHGGVCHYRPSEHLRHKQGIKDLVAVGGNFTRLELGGQGPLPDWPNYNNYSEKLGEMDALDKIIDLCEEEEIYFILFRHHVEVMDNGDPNSPAWNGISWFDNPYRLPFELENVQEYYEHEEVLKWQKYALRYVISRWGYSTQFAFYGFSEIDNWISKIWEDKNQSKRLDGGNLKERDALAVFHKWVKAQQDFVKEELNDRIQFIHSYASLPSSEFSRRAPGFLDLSDVIALHDYAEGKNSNYGRRFENMHTAWDKYKKPVLLEEMGVNRISIYCCTGIEFHNSIWATAMMGGIGTGMDWWWDRGVFDFGYHNDFIDLKAFFDTLNTFDFHSIHQWQDNRSKNGKRRNIENYYTIDKSQNNVVGWVHNARYYWRNLSSSDSCIAHLVKTDSVLGPCLVAHNPYRTKRYEGNGDYCYPGDYHNLGAERFYDFDHPRYADKYTGMKDLSIGGEEDERLFKVKNLKSRFFPWVHAKKHWYKVTFYPTTNNPEMKEAVQYRQFVSSSIFGNIKVKIPKLDALNSDYAYKVEYLGLEKEKEVVPQTISTISW